MARLSRNNPICQVENLMTLNIQHFFDTSTSTLSYVVWDADTSDAVIIDPVLDFDSVNLTFSRRLACQVAKLCCRQWTEGTSCTGTHIHADHITGHLVCERNWYVGCGVIIATDSRHICGVAWLGWF